VDAAAVGRQLQEGRFVQEGFENHDVCSLANSGLKRKPSCWLFGRAKN
jgi:hypothetical protein